MKKPSVRECLEDIRRLRAENERLRRVIEQQRPELASLRNIATGLRDYVFNGHMKLRDLYLDVQALLPGNDDLPSLTEMGGIFSAGAHRVDEAIKALEVRATERQETPT